VPEINSIRLAKVLQNYIAETKIKIRHFAEEAGISHSYLVMLKNGFHPKDKKPVEPTMDTLIKLAKAMDMPLADLLIEIGYLTEEDREKLAVLPSGKGYIRFIDKAHRANIHPEIMEDFIKLVLKIKQM